MSILLYILVLVLIEMLQVDFQPRLVIPLVQELFPAQYDISQHLRQQ
jgi:hypothetical protein